MPATDAIAVRPAEPHDRAAIPAQVPRPAATVAPPGRDATQAGRAGLHALAAALDRRDAAISVSGVDAHTVGFIHVRTVRDCCAASPIAHVHDVVVACDAEGRRVAAG